MKRHTSAIAVVAAIAVAALAALFAGCESSEGITNAYWSEKDAKNNSSASSTASQSSGSTAKGSSAAAAGSGGSAAKTSSSSGGSPAKNSTAAAAPSPGAADAVPFGALRWTFGGINGASAAKTSASIGALRMSRNGLSYKWTGATLSSWGLSNDAAGAYACLFVLRSDGAWVGGKFDWISTSRCSRSLENIYGGYGGWSLGGVPNPCSVAFVIVSSDGKKRTNVISSRWSR